MSVTFTIVSAEDDDVRLDRWFKRHYPALPHGQLEKLLRTKQIKVDGKKATSNQRLQEGQEIRVPPLAHLQLTEVSKRKHPHVVVTDKDAAMIQQSVLYRDNDVIAINKPAGLAVQGGVGVGKSLDDMLGALMFEAEERPKLVHRLDKDTSGVLLLARSTKVAAQLTNAFRDRSVTKTYWALVAGVPQPERGKIDLPLIKQGGAGNEKMVVDPEHGQSAVTLYETLEHVSKYVSWVALHPVTGRTHQLRAHMQAIGHPIIGDGKYGGKQAFIDGIAEQMHLHAHAIHIPHFNGRAISVIAPLPSHMQESFDLLGFCEEVVI